MSTRPGIDRAELVAALRAEERAAAARAVGLHGAIASRLGITITDVSCLGVLDKDGPMPAGELAARVGLTRGGAITTMIDRLEKAGFLVRRRDVVDRRRVLVEIVRDGPFRRLHSALDAINADYAALIAGYGETELHLLLDYTRRTNTIMHERAAELASPSPSG